MWSGRRSVFTQLRHGYSLFAGDVGPGTITLRVKALEKFERAIRLCPQPPPWYIVMLYSKGEHASAINTLQRAVAMESESVYGRVWLTSALIEAGFAEDARSMAQEVTTVDSDFTVSKWMGCAFKNQTFNRKITDNLLEAGLPT